MKKNYETLVGEKIAELFDLKFGHEGTTNTRRGEKNIHGIGACVLSCIEQVNNNLQKQAMREDAKWNYDRGIITTEEYNEQLIKNS